MLFCEMNTVIYFFEYVSNNFISLQMINTGGKEHVSVGMVESCCMLFSALGTNVG